MEMLLRQDLSRDADLQTADTRLRQVFMQVFSDSGFVLSEDPTIVQHRFSTDMFYVPFETRNMEVEGALWSSLEPRLTRLLSWLKRDDRVWVNRRTREVTTIPQSGEPWAGLVLPRAKLPNNTSAGLHIHFHAEQWFGDFDHAVRFAELWNKSREFFKQGAHPARYKAGVGYTATGIEHADLSRALNVPSPEVQRRLKTEWGPYSMTPGGYPISREQQEMEMEMDQTTKKQVTKILKWMALHRWTALNLNKVDVRKDIEFRLAHGTMNMGTISHWVQLFAALIEATRDVRGPTSFSTHLWREERPLMMDFIKRSGKLSKADTSHADPYGPPKKLNRPIRRLLYPPGAKFLEVT